MRSDPGVADATRRPVTPAPGPHGAPLTSIKPAGVANRPALPPGPPAPAAPVPLAPVNLEKPSDPPPGETAASDGEGDAEPPTRSPGPGPATATAITAAPAAWTSGTLVPAPGPALVLPAVATPALPVAIEDQTPARSGGGSQLRRWLRQLLRGRESDSLRTTIEGLMDSSGSLDEAIGTPERALISNVLKLRDLTVIDTMVPRADIAAIDIQDPADSIMEQLVEGVHSRYPIYARNLDDVLGFIHVKDVFKALARNQPVDLMALKREVMIVSPSLPVLDLLPEMRARRVHMAMVVDEFGGIDGLVTIEDLVELIVGEIQDEHDVEDSAYIIRRPDGSLVVDARVMVEDLERELSLTLMTEAQRDEIDTIGGLIFDMAGHVPARGALFRHEAGLEFEVLEADPRRIRRIKIRRLSGPLAAE